MTLGSRIYQLRTAKNFSQSEMAEALDVSRQSVSKWETDASVPELDKLIGICELFGVSMDELVRGDGKRQEQETVPEYAAPDVRASTRKKRSKAPVVVGIILLCLAVLTILPVLALLSTAYWSTAIAAWFVLLTAGIICLSVKQRAVLWTIWGASFVYSAVVTVCNVIVQIRLIETFPLSALIPNFAYVGAEVLLLIVTVLLIRKKK